MTAVLEKPATRKVEENQAQVAIDALDLTDIKQKLIRDNGWSVERCEAAEVWYRRFLKLCVLQSEVVVPLGDIDELWHTHILFTRKYHNDCKLIFGRYQHHTPMLGYTEEEKVDNHENRVKTHHLFKQFFGESPVADAACGCDNSGTNCCSNDS